VVHEAVELTPVMVSWMLVVVFAGAGLFAGPGDRAGFHLILNRSR